jgi:hypothetical protein
MEIQRVAVLRSEGIYEQFGLGDVFQKLVHVDGVSGNSGWVCRGHEIIHSKEATQKQGGLFVATGQQKVRS